MTPDGHIAIPLDVAANREPFVHRWIIPGCFHCRRYYGLETASPTSSEIKLRTKPQIPSIEIRLTYPIISNGSLAAPPSIWSRA